MSFSTDITKSVSDFRILIHVDSKDGNYAGRFSFDSFTPIGSVVPYDGRVRQAPSISINRDSNQFGILVYSSSGFTLNNADGLFDTLIENYNVIGATFRLYIGYVDLNISEYVNIYTGYIESINIDENEASFSVADLRKRLQTGNSTDISFVNSVQGIENILLGNYAITAGSTYFDVSAMTAAKSLAYDVIREAPVNDTVEAAISDCVISTMGFFFITGDGRYSYKMVDIAATSVGTISHYDIINPISINYDSSGIIASSSVKAPNYPPQFLATHSSIFVVATAFTTVFECTLPNNGALIGVSLPTTSTLNVYSSYDHCKSMANISNLSLSNQNFTSLQRLTNDYILLGTYSSTDVGILYRSTDYGSTWSSIVTSNSIMRITKDINGICYFSNSISSSVKSIYKSVDYGSSFSLVYNTLPNESIDQIEIGNTASTVIMTKSPSITSTSVSIYRSVDFASSFTQIMTISETSITLNTSILYLNGIFYISVIFDNSIALYQSLDDGITWTTFYTFYDAKNLRSGIYKLRYDNNMDLFGINVDGLLYKSEKSFDNKNIISTISPISYDSTIRFYLNFDDGTTVYNKKDVGVVITKIDPTKLYYINNTYKASTYSQYGIDTLQHFNTVLTNYSDAQTLGTDLIEYYKDLHGTFSIQVPVKYYTVNIGDNVDVEIWRERQQFLGTKKCEVMGKSYNLENGFINFDLRII